MKHTGYSMTAEVKVLRRKHLVGFYAGSTRVSDLIGYLQSVPSDAVVDEVIEADADNFATIEFYEEAVTDD